MDSIRVCIVGAGVSGLRAAQHLLDLSRQSRRQYNITILEARDRIGGRVAQIDVPVGDPDNDKPALVDAGACYIHGTENHPIADLARDLGFETITCGTVDSIYDESGNKIPEAEAGAAYENVWDVIGDAVEIDDDGKTSAKMGDSFWKFAQSKVDEGVASGRWGDDVDGGRMMSIMEMWGAFIGEEPTRQSLAGMWLEQGIEGDNLVLKETYAPVVKYLADAVLPYVEIQLNTPVTRIHTRSSSEDERTEITTCASSEPAVFDHVIVTVPIGYLKLHASTLFSPPLPRSLSRAIANTGIARLEKVFLRFPSAWWDPSGTFPVETLFLRPGYAPSWNPEKFRQEAMSLSALGVPVLMFFVYGAWSDRVRARTDMYAPASAAYLSVVNDLFRPYYSRLAGYDGTQEASAVVLTDWARDEWAGFGAYSNHTINGGDTVEDWRVLRRQGEDLGGGGEAGEETMGQRRVWFAGEHVAPVQGLGTVVGAWWSGEEAARRVIEAE